MTLNIKSLNAACYITTITDLEASVQIQDDGLKYFEFPKTAGIMTAYDSYRNATRAQSELMIDLTKFNHYVRMYKSKSRKAGSR